MPRIAHRNVPQDPVTRAELVEQMIAGPLGLAWRNLDVLEPACAFAWLPLPFGLEIDQAQRHQ